MTLYASKAGPLASSDLYTIDPLTGTATSVAAMSVALTGMAMDPTDSTMYGVTSNNSNNPRYLVTVDLGTGGTTLVGELLDGVDSHNCADIAFDSFGQLYGWSEFSDSLVTIDKTTGMVTPFASVLSTFGDGMDFDWEDKLYGIFDGDGNSLWEVDPSDGTLTTITTLGGDGYAIAAGAMQDDKFYILRNESPQVFLATIDYYGGITTIGQTLDRMDALATDDPGGRSDWHGQSPYPVTEDWEPAAINPRWEVYRSNGTSPIDPNKRGLTLVIPDVDDLDEILDVSQEGESWFELSLAEHIEGVQSLRLNYKRPTKTNFDKQQLVYRDPHAGQTDVEYWLAYGFMIPDWSVVWNSDSGWVELPDFRIVNNENYFAFTGIGHFLVNFDAPTNGILVDWDGGEHPIVAGAWNELRMGYKRRLSDNKIEVTMYLNDVLIVDHSVSTFTGSPPYGIQWNSQYDYKTSYYPQHPPESMLYIDPLVWSNADPGPLFSSNFIYPPSIGQTTTVYPPLPVVTVPFIGPTGVAFTPTLTTADIRPPFIDSTSVVFTPSAPQDVSMPFIGPVTTIEAPFLIGPDAARFTQVPVEVLVQGESSARITQVPVEVIVQGGSSARITQVPVEVVRRELYEFVTVVWWD